MTRKAPKLKRSGRRGDPVSLAPLTPDQALAGLLRVKPSDVKKLEAQNANAKKPKGKRAPKAKK